jgi:hypothetical protein
MHNRESLHSASAGIIVTPLLFEDVIKSFKYCISILKNMSRDYTSDPLVSFLVDVNEDPEFRRRFLRNPVPILETMLGHELSEKQIEQINKVAPMLLQYVEGIEEITTGLEKLIEALKEGTELNSPVEDDSAIL